ncbi:MAG: double zinc ribbon domain-containing protein, partial [Aphanizomenon sp.]
MLTCPQCKFKNPNINKFCQNCGTSLTHKICPQCSTKVALNIQHCPQCRTECSTTSYALITQEEHQVVSVIPEPTQLTQNLENIANENSHTSPFHQI